MPPSVTGPHTTFCPLPSVPQVPPKTPPKCPLQVQASPLSCVGNPGRAFVPVPDCGLAHHLGQAPPLLFCTLSALCSACGQSCGACPWHLDPTFASHLASSRHALPLLSTVLSLSGSGPVAFPSRPHFLCSGRSLPLAPNPSRSLTHSLSLPHTPPVCFCRSCYSSPADLTPPLFSLSLPFLFFCVFSHSPSLLPTLTPPTTTTLTLFELSR